ncbi:MAG TPA: biopolymer transporter ExbD [Terrimicrobiaceae bacterium]|nr:biopolymer transporter ExbD [Terrimicrobiaceae bacterium]
MKLRRTSAPHPGLLFLAPALGLMMILIFFLLLSTTFLVQPGVAVSVPESPFVLSPQRNPRIISITAPPLSAVFFENEETSIPLLRERLKNLRGRTQTIIVKADKHALYEGVAAVMNVALELGFPVVLATAEEGAVR